MQNSSKVVRIRAWRFFKGSSFEPSPCNVNAEPCVVEIMIIFLLLFFEELQSSPLCCWQFKNRPFLIRSVCIVTMFDEIGNSIVLVVVFSFVSWHNEELLHLIRLN